MLTRNSKRTKHIASATTSISSRTLFLITNRLQIKEVIDLFSSKTEQQSSDWCNHEHVSDQIQREAESFVEKVGSAEIAKFAIDALAQRPNVSPQAHDTTEFIPEAEQLGGLERVLVELENMVAATSASKFTCTEWAEEVLRTVEMVGDILRGSVREEHEVRFSSVVQSRSEFSIRVEHLRALDDQLALIEYAKLKAKAERLLILARSGKPSDVASASADLIQFSEDFIASARQQEVASVSLFDDCFSRDLGMDDLQ